MKSIGLIAVLILLSLPILGTILTTLFLFLLPRGGLFSVETLFWGVFINFFLFLIDLVMIIAATVSRIKNGNLSGKEMAVYAAICSLCLGLHFLAGYGIIWINKNTNFFN